jgi:hypothetical protein
MKWILVGKWRGENKNACNSSSTTWARTVFSGSKGHGFRSVRQALNVGYSSLSCVELSRCKLPSQSLTNGLHFEHAHFGGQGIKVAEQSVQHIHDVLWLALLAQGSEGNDVLWQN